MKSGGTDRKMLLNRFLSLGAIAANFNSGNKQIIEFGKDEEDDIISLAVSSMGRLDSDEQIYLINKIILLNKESALLDMEDCFNVVIENFSAVLKPHKIIQNLICSRKLDQCRRIFDRQDNHISIHKAIPTLLNLLEFNQSHAESINDLFLVNRCCG